jgi:hypothetical protein
MICNVEVGLLWLMVICEVPDTSWLYPTNHTRQSGCKAIVQQYRETNPINPNGGEADFFFLALEVNRFFDRGKSIHLTDLRAL